jgi:hypothetical protein
MPIPSKYLGGNANENGKEDTDDVGNDRIQREETMARKVTKRMQREETMAVQVTKRMQVEEVAVIVLILNFMTMNGT